MLKTIGAALGVGLYWFLIGSFFGFIVFEGLVDPEGKIADIWPAVLGLPGFFGGVAFYTLTRIAERGRKLHEVPLPRAAIWGALCGPLLVGLWVLSVEMGFGDWKDGQIPWLQMAQNAGLTAPAFAIAGCFSVWMARNVAAPPGTRSQVSRPS